LQDDSPARTPGPPTGKGPRDLGGRDIKKLAKRTEKEVNNLMEGTCATAAMLNVVRAQLAGRKAWVLECEGLAPTGIFGEVLLKMGLSDSRLARFLEKQGLMGREGAAHAIAVIEDGDGFKYLSWGRVETDWKGFAREIFGDQFQGRQGGGFIQSLDQHVKWMVDHKWDYPNPQTGQTITRALVGWLGTTGK